ncbi:MAG: HEPN domain-containing protein, partial [Hyphomicrobiaceae bacterium]
TLARHFLNSAKRFQRLRPPSFRDSVSRSYYSMYHAARTVTYVFHRGDDHEEHNALHKALPDDLPNVDQWRNDLKAARLRRNEADYEPYPKPDGDFAAIGKSQLTNAATFLIVTETYLKAKGCRI